MAASKSLSTIIAAATSNGAGSTTTGTVVDLTTKYGALVTIKITNGATAPTIAAQANIYTSGDNTNFKLFYTVASDLVNSSVNEWAVPIPAQAMYCRVDITGNTGQAVTAEAFAQVLVGV
jgi:hypothetical protein